MTTTMLDATADAALVAGHVAALAGDDGVAVVLGDGRRMECARLYTSDAGLTLAAGDEVMVMRQPDGTGVVVGRIGPSHAAAAAVEPSSAVPDELVIEAGTCLTLRVGGGSITLREDGRILVKGTDLVSHATRMNRIRGGSVDIN